jgi:hypothetical protein
MAKTRKQKKRKLASAKRRAETHSHGFERTTTTTPEGMSYFQLKASGMKRIDVLPHVVKETNKYADAGELHYEKTFFVHRIGPNGDAYICREKTTSEKCPVCEHLAKLRRDPNADEELIKSLRPKERQLFYVIDHDEPEKGVQLWDISYYLFGKQLDARIKNSEEDDGFDLFFDPGSEGLTLRLGIAERSFSGRAFYEVETVDFKPRKNAIDPELYEDLPSLDDLIKVEGYNKLKSIFLQTTEEGEEEEEEVEEVEEEVIPATIETVASKNGDEKEEGWDEEDDEEDDDDDDWDD